MSDKAMPFLSVAASIRCWWTRAIKTPCSAKRWRGIILPVLMPLSSRTPTMITWDRWPRLMAWCRSIAFSLPVMALRALVHRAPSFGSMRKRWWGRNGSRVYRKGICSGSVLLNSPACGRLRFKTKAATEIASALPWIPISMETATGSGEACWWGMPSMRRFRRCYPPG